MAVNKTFTGTALSITPLFEGNPLTHRHEILSQETEVLGAAVNWNFHSREPNYVGTKVP